MASPSAPTSVRQPPELPNEILLLVIQNCPRATLKNVRLASKNLAQMAEPILWQKVVFVPNDHCILGFSKAMKRSKVTKHVHKLVYDARFGNFFNFIKTREPDPTVEWPEGEKARVDALVERAAQGRFLPGDDAALEVAMLVKALRILPNVREVRIHDYEESTNPVIKKVPFFYQKICNLLQISLDSIQWSRMGTSACRSYTKGILTAAFSAGCRFQNIKAKNLDGRALFGFVPVRSSSSANQQLHIFQSVMDNLRALELSFRDNTLLPTANHIECIQSFLMAAKKVKTLTLRLTDSTISRYQYHDDEVNSELSGLLESATGTWMSRPLLPQLENLRIDACTCHSEDLIHFLKIHSATLRRLELSNITLLGGEDRRECWVKLIKLIKSHLKLTHVSFNGWITNGGRQHWFVAKDTVGKARLKARVEKYVVDKRIREHPLELLAIPANEPDVVKPANGEDWEGDLTWTMVYAGHMADQMDWQLTPPVFSSSSPDSSGPSSATGDEVQSLLSEDPTSESWQELEIEPLITIDVEPHSVQFDDWFWGSKKKKKSKTKVPASAWDEQPFQGSPVSYSTTFYSDASLTPSQIQPLNSW